MALQPTALGVLKPNQQSINIMNHNQPEFDYSVVIELKPKASKKNPKLVTFTKLFLKTKQVGKVRTDAGFRGQEKEPVHPQED